MKYTPVQFLSRENLLAQTLHGRERPAYSNKKAFSIYKVVLLTRQISGLCLICGMREMPAKKKSLRGKPRSIVFFGFKSLLSQQAAGNLTQEKLKSYESENAN